STLGPLRPSPHRLHGACRRASEDTGSTPWRRHAPRLLGNGWDRAALPVPSANAVAMRGRTSAPRRSPVHRRRGAASPGATCSGGPPGRPPAGAMAAEEGAGLEEELMQLEEERMALEEELEQLRFEVQEARLAGNAVLTAAEAVMAPLMAELAGAQRICVENGQLAQASASDVVLASSDGGGDAMPLDTSPEAE
ncbi:unnamed protein product, partial [Prorocentrum cordatum]